MFSWCFYREWCIKCTIKCTVLNIYLFLSREILHTEHLDICTQKHLSWSLHTVGQQLRKLLVPVFLCCLLTVFPLSFMYNFNSAASALQAGDLLRGQFNADKTRQEISQSSCCASSTMIKHAVLLLIVNPPTDLSLLYLLGVIYIQ